MWNILLNLTVTGILKKNTICNLWLWKYINEQKINRIKKVNESKLDETILILEKIISVPFQSNFNVLRIYLGTFNVNSSCVIFTLLSYLNKYWIKHKTNRSFYVVPNCTITEHRGDIELREKPLFCDSYYPFVLEYVFYIFACNICNTNR